ncbi:PREDICTED: glutathione S-transferase B-like [Rhagoletis zephyria]|uniref:glutathione S-transferase B-like n=1 Tax=Rhagoletis zephyria TaxID=28612 RepID=UPI00081124E0|nr:PREDICTED: glutathione S-transferase B-like [Rhagoletis zephyria]
MSEIESEAKGEAPLLGYYNIRGNAQPIRLLLAYTKTVYRERQYNFGRTDEERAEWLKEKFHLGLDFPNLPYWQEGDLKLTQSLTILRHLAAKNGLAGNGSEEEAIRIDLAEQVLREYRNKFIDATLSTSFEKARLAYLAQLPDMLRSLSTYLGARPYFAGNSITYVDFMAYEFIDQHFYLYAELFAKLSNLKAFLRRVEALPTIHEFQYSPKYIRWPSGLLIPWYQAKYYTTFHRSDSSDRVHELVTSMAKCQKIVEGVPPMGSETVTTSG